MDMQLRIASHTCPPTTSTRFEIRPRHLKWTKKFEIRRTGFQIAVANAKFVDVSQTLEGRKQDLKPGVRYLSTEDTAYRQRGLIPAAQAYIGGVGHIGGIGL
eukprot:717755-Rhodomonas_salina.3